MKTVILKAAAKDKVKVAVIKIGKELGVSLKPKVIIQITNIIKKEIEEADNLIYSDYIKSTMIKEVQAKLLKEEFSTGSIKYLNKISSFLRRLEKKNYDKIEKEKDLEKIVDLLKAKIPAGKIKKTKDAKVIKLANIQLKNAIKNKHLLSDFIKWEEPSMMGMKIEDTIDHIKLANALAEGNMKKAVTLRNLDTSSRELIPGSVWKYLEKF